METWRENLIPAANSIRATIETLENIRAKVALIVDDGEHLLGTVTDGDIRRAILRGADLDRPVVEVMNSQPRTVRDGDSEDHLRDILLTHRLSYVPVLADDRRVVGLIRAEDILTRPGETREKENWVVLMAGGLGMRLRPLTEGRPKPLLEIGNKPLLETIIETFIEQGFRKFYLSLNYKAEMVRQHFGDGGNWNAEIRYLEEGVPLGTAGSLRLIEDRPTLPIIVMNGDLLTKINFHRLLEYHQHHGARATMCVREYDLQVPFGVVNIDEHRITSVNEKPVHSFFVNAGIYVLDPELIEFIPDDTRYDITTLFQSAVDAGLPSAAFPIHEYWLDIGHLDDYQRANREFGESFSK